MQAIEAGGVAAMEVLARDLRALGLYTARSLSYDGVEYEMLVHELTPEQREVYDRWAESFAIIHRNLTAALEAANVTGAGGTLNAQAKSAARSAFESAKQRFFGHLLTGMKTPSLIRAIEADLATGHSAVIQIVSTGEALMERRLSDISTEDWGDVRIDITPREACLDYMQHSFPVQLYEPCTDSEGNLCSRPVTDVKAEKRFLSTIARRLDTLGAITRGQRQTGGQGLFRPEDNLESPYARDALRQLYRRIYRGDVAGCSLGEFEDATGLTLTDANGLKDDLPPITTFLNRLLALTIAMQGVLFTEFEALLDARIEGAIAAGVYDLGLETLRAESFRVTDAEVIYTHPGSGAETQLLTIAQRVRNRPTSLADALNWLDDPKARLLVNSRSGRAAVQVSATSLMLEDGTMEPRVRLFRPMEAATLPAKMMEDTHWLEADRARFSAAWTAELAEVPEFSESTLHIVAGLLLPIWKTLPQDETRVYRLQTDEGHRIIGRRVSPAWVATTLAKGAAPSLTPAEVHALLLEGKTVVKLAEGLELYRSRVMGVNRIELSGFTAHQKDRLKADGLFSEIIAWKLRLFCPTDDSGVAILGTLLARFPVQALHARQG